MIKIPLLTFRNYGKSEAKAEIWKTSHPKSLKFSQRIGDVKTKRVLKYFCDTIIILSNMTNFSQGSLVPTRGYKFIHNKIHTRKKLFI